MFSVTGAMHFPFISWICHNRIYLFLEDVCHLLLLDALATEANLKRLLLILFK